MRQNIKAQSGNRIIAVFDNIQIGLIQSIRGSDDYGPEPASGIGDIHVQEYVPTMARHSVSVSYMVLMASSMRSAGIAMENGDAVLQGLVFDIHVLEKDTGRVLRKYISCSYASGEIDVQKHTILMSSAVFNALDVQGIGI